MRIFGALMSTKNLARTAIEGGRCGYYQAEVRAQKRSERAAVRTYLRDPDEARVDPRRKPVRVCFSDKLRPIERYLDSQAGRPWDKVRGELFKRFDTRTTPGRHVLFDHVLRDVEEPRLWSHQPPLVDAHGILQRRDRKRYRRERPTPFDRHAAAQWLGGRKVVPNGERFVWLAPTDRHANVHAYFPRFSPLVYVVHDEEGLPIRDWDARARTWRWRVPAVTWLPRGLLSRAEEDVYRAIPAEAFGR